MKRIITGVLVLILVTLLLAGCGTVTLDNVSVEYIQGDTSELCLIHKQLYSPISDASYFLIYKDPNVIYEKVKLVLNHEYTASEFTIDDDGPWVLVWLDGFLDDESNYFNPEETKPTHFKISCDLADGKHGEYIEIWD